MNRVISFLIGTGCGAASLQIFERVSFENWTLLILSPVQFMVGMVCFTFSFVCLAGFVHDVLREVFLLIVGEGAWGKLLIGLPLVICFMLLFHYYGFGSLGILLFTIVYGIISIDFSMLKESTKRRQ